MAAPDLQRLASRVYDRRRQLNLSIKRAAEQGPMSKDTWMRVEGGKEAQHQTYDKVDRVLQWTVGSCRKILEGGDAIPLTDDDARILPVPPADLAAAVGDAMKDALIATTDDLTSSEIRTATVRAVEILRERGILPPEA